MLSNPDPLHALQADNNRLKDENHWLRQENLRLHGTIRALCELRASLESVSPQMDVFDLLNRLLSLALAAVDSREGSLQLLDEESGELVFAAARGAFQDRLIGFRLPPGEGIAGWAVQNRSAVLVPDVRLEARFSPLVDQTLGFSTNSLMCVPLVDTSLAGAGRIQGVVEVVNTCSGEPFQEQDLDVLTLFGLLAAMALARAEGQTTT